jgi:hypothetical protein
LMRFLLLIIVLAALAEPVVQAQPLTPQEKAKALRQLKQLKGAPAIERFLAMTPQQRERALAALPPERRQQILARLQALELLSDDERELLRGRLQAFTSLPPARRQAVRREIQALRALPRPQRLRRLESPELRENFSEQELQLLRDVTGPRNPPE